MAADDVIDEQAMSPIDAVDGSSTRHVSAMDVGAVKAPTIRRSQIMQAITTIGLDIAKSVFQVHGVDAARPPWWQGDARHHALTQRFETSALSHSAGFEQRRRCSK